MEKSAEKFNASRRYAGSLKYFQTLCLSLAFLSLGLYMSIFGPTLPTLSHNLQVRIDIMSYILPARAVGYLSGSIVSGLIYQKINRYLMMFCSLCGTAIGISLIPHMSHIAFVAVVMCFVSLSAGFLDTAGNVMCLQLWGEKSGPFLQALHFSFALGTTIAPLVAMPFIMDVKLDNKTEKVIIKDLNATDADAPFQNTSVSEKKFERFYPVVYAYAICAAFAFLVALFFLYLGCWCRKSSSISNQENTVKEEGKIYRTKMLILLFLFFMVYVGTEETFGAFVYTFAVSSQRQYSKSQASLINSLFWGAFAVGRFIAIPIAKFISPSKIMVIDLIGRLGSAFVLAFFPLFIEKAEFLFWISIAIYGLSMASIFPTGISWAEQYITVTGRAAMVLVVGSATGAMVLPVFIGQLLASDPMSLMYFLVTSGCISITNFGILLLVARTRGKRLKTSINKRNKSKKQGNILLE